MLQYTEKLLKKKNDGREYATYTKYRVNSEIPNKEESMEDNKYNIIWTIIWFIFITLLVFIFKSANPLWLLVLWIMGTK